MKTYIVLAINKNLDEIKKQFNTKEEAQQYVEKCKANQCFGINLIEK